MKHLLLCLVSIAILSSCDIIDAPYRKEVKNPDPIDPDDTLSPLRYVLLEKFTGQICGPCPPANDEAKQIVDEFKRVSVISYHAGNLSKPDVPNGYTYEFRTQTGNEIGSAFFNATTADNIITPMGVIDRMGYDTVSKIRITYKNWKTNIGNRLSITSPVVIRLYPWYNPNTKTLEVGGFVYYLEPGFKDYHVAIALVEDSIVKPQKQPDGSKIVDYVHKSVFRSNIPNNAWGSTITNTDQPAKSQISFTRVLQLPNDADWDIKHLKVVGYVYRNFNTPRVSREVLQSTTEKVKIVP